MAASLANKVFIGTCAASGIGLATAKLLLSRGIARHHRLDFSRIHSGSKVWTRYPTHCGLKYEWILSKSITDINSKPL
ncbi:hypothetical protein BDV38DRAFT_260315 [Aspergillus pseudotamarii]|uniref:Uncharacterized protein n=1 Tax=Aspergillus pseudotamarii TaxID=132259 RepID=A0A5N6SDM6_ASPPS|nr:uncharacterized protein BDV38DRAFT_260315 [Aspergillus pseudotamarii]KAE8132826.1 hypothetical protein BDV38DRAFT_260315 [Aspergillus pseudotamarii]